MMTQKPGDTRWEGHIRISQRLKSELEAIAEERECSLTQLIRDVLREYVGQQRREGPP